MTKQEFNIRVDNVVDRLIKNPEYSCIEINVEIGKKARKFYSFLFQPNHFEANQTWIIEDHEVIYEKNQSTLRVNMVELFRQKCLDEKLYVEF